MVKEEEGNEGHCRLLQERARERDASVGVNEKEKDRIRVELQGE